MKTCEVKVYLTDEQKKRIKEYAEERGMRLSVFIRYATLCNICDVTGNSRDCTPWRSEEGNNEAAVVAENSEVLLRRF